MKEDCAAHAPAYIRVGFSNVDHPMPRPTGITQIGGSTMESVGPIWVCNDCGAFLVQDFADDPFRPITKAEYNEWIKELNERLPPPLRRM
jgi:hypothetical protein